MLCLATAGLDAEFWEAGLSFAALSAGDCEPTFVRCDFADWVVPECGFAASGRAVSLAAVGLDSVAFAGFPAGVFLAWSLDWTSCAEWSLDLPCGVVDFAPVVDSVLSDFWGAETLFSEGRDVLVEPALGFTA